MNLVLGVAAVIRLYYSKKREENKPSGGGVAVDLVGGGVLSIHGGAAHPGAGEGDSEADGEYQGEEELHSWMAFLSRRGHYIPLLLTFFCPVQRDKKE